MRRTVATDMSAYVCSSADSSKGFVGRVLSKPATSDWISLDLDLRFSLGHADSIRFTSLLVSLTT
jgi:hypothetical protein